MGVAVIVPGKQQVIVNVWTNACVHACMQMCQILHFNFTVATHHVKGEAILEGQSPQGTWQTHVHGFVHAQEIDRCRGQGSLAPALICLQWWRPSPGNATTADT